MTYGFLLLSMGGDRHEHVRQPKVRRPNSLAVPSQLSQVDNIDPYEAPDSKMYKSQSNSLAKAAFLGK